MGNPLTLRESYLTELDRNGIAAAEKFLLGRTEENANVHETLIWHLWRFQGFDALQDLREHLLQQFLSGSAITWQGLELLYYLQEQQIGRNEMDVAAVHCEAIFKSMCSRMTIRRNMRPHLIQRGLVAAGLPSTGTDLDLPVRGEPDVDALYPDLPECDWLLLELARWNRSEPESRALYGRSLDTAEVTAKPELSQCAEIYIGPYYFHGLTDTQRANARLPNSFRSPFRIGLRLLMDDLLQRGWQILPLLCWRGALAPHARRSARLSFSYHTHGRIPGRVHYKFGHFSDLLQLDTAGYAGFATLAEIPPEQIMAATEKITETELVACVQYWRQRYIEQRVTWREQSAPIPIMLERGRRTLFLALQDPYDEVAQLGHLTPAEIIQTLQAVLAIDDIVYVKRHPVDNSGRTNTLLAGLQNDLRFRLVDHSIHDLFNSCELVLTVNSGVGFEALLAGVPVVVAGLSDYNSAVITVRNVAELISVLMQPLPAPAVPPQRFIYYYFENFILDPSNIAVCKQRLSAKLDALLDNMEPPASFQS